MVFLALAAGITTGGRLLFLAQQQQTLNAVKEDLAAIALLKTEQIRAWRQERLSDAQEVAADPEIARNLPKAWDLSSPLSPVLQKEIQEHFASLPNSLGCTGIGLLDSSGRVVFSHGTGEGGISPPPPDLVAQALSSPRGVIGDLRLIPTPPGIVIDIVAPPFHHPSIQRAPAAVALQFSPRSGLFPLIKKWPGASRTAEVLLVRRQGAFVVFLNELRHRPDSALKLRLPLTMENLPAGKAFLSPPGVMEGLDYRREPVLAAFQNVPDSAWAVVAKIDREEAAAPTRALARAITISTLALIFSAAAITALIANNQRHLYLRRQVEFVAEREALSERLDQMARFANEAILLLDDQGKILEANDLAVEIYEYPREELLKLTIRDLESESTRDRHSVMVSDAFNRGEKGFRFESIHRRSNGTLFPVEASARLVAFPEKQLLQTIVRDITDQRRAAEALEASHRRFRTIFENATEAVLLLEGLRIVDCNPAACELFGRSRQWLLGRTPIDLSPPFQPNGSPSGDLAATWPAVVRKEGRKQFEWRHIRPQGGQFDAEIDLSPVELDGRQMILNFTRDVTERKQAEQQLIRARDFYLTLFNRFPDLIWRAGIDGRTNYFNETWLTFTGRTPEQELGDGWLEGVHPDDRMRRITAFHEAFSTRQPFELEYRLRRNDGEYRWIIDSGRPFFDLDGAFSGFVGACRDITAHRLAEQELQLSNERYRLLFDANPYPMWVYDLDSLHFLAVNEAAVVSYGYSREEFLSMSIKDIAPPDQVFLIDEYLVRLRQPGRVLVGPFRHRKKDGTVVDVEAVSERIYFAGRPARLSAISDLTDKRLLEEQLRLSQKLEAVGQLAGGIAHDFNNLLTAIAGYTDMVLRDTPTEDHHYSNLMEVRKATQRAAAITRQLLAYSRRQILVPEPLDLNNLVVEMTRMLERLIGETITLETHLAPDLGTVLADPGQVEQVVMNLAINARDAMPGGGRMTIQTANVFLDEEHALLHKLPGPGPYALLQVSDTGVGMSPEVISRIFEPFFTTKDKERGTGLGLSTVYGIVKQSKGAIWVFSEPGEGTTFKVFLPISTAPVRQKEKRIPIFLPAHGWETVLLVEDDSAVRALASTVLVRCGYQLLTAPSGIEALEIAGRFPKPIHLLLTDVVMPGLGGKELAEQLRVFRPEMKVLFMSGYSGTEAEHRGLLDTTGFFLQKPFSTEELTNRVREALGPLPQPVPGGPES